jgi:hypothetical protein
MGNYSYAQDTLSKDLLQRVFMLAVFERAQSYGDYNKNSEYCCGIQKPDPTYIKELKSYGFSGKGNVKFYTCRFAGINCDTVLWPYIRPNPMYVFALMEKTKYSSKIYRIDGFDKCDFIYLIGDIYGWNTKMHRRTFRSKKQFVKEFYIETINMELLYEYRKLDLKYLMNIRKYNKKRLKQYVHDLEHGAFL